MKKWLALTLALAMSLSLCACGGGEDGEAPAPEDGGDTASGWQTLTLNDADSTTFTMQYPEEFTFNPETRATTSCIRTTPSAAPWKAPTTA